MVANLHSVFRAFLALGLLILWSADLAAQRSPFDSAWTKEAEQIREEVDCFTDRSLYICEELIQFSARVSLSGVVGPRPWSTVLYVELVSYDGKRMASGKFPIRKGLASGEIRVPAYLLTGYYYLRTYTRWMRNRGAETFNYLPLRIINPHRSELYEASSAESGAKIHPVPGNQTLELGFLNHASSFERGDSVTLELMFSGEQVPDSLGGCLTVVHPGAAPSYSQYVEHSSEESFRVDFLPDRYGPSLSGKVNYPNGATEGLPPALIHLSLVGDATGYLVCRSDSKGKFTVGLPMRSGKLEIFVQAEGPDEEAVEVLIDQDFDPRQVHFQPPAFTLTEQEMEWAAIMARNVQLSNIYEITDSLAISGAADESFSFYGTPTFSVDLDEYVLLPTLREVFLNFVPGVTPLNRKGRVSLLIESENPSLSLYASLVMVDQVPVLDLEQFMSLSPAKIKQIDVVEDVYVRGDMRYGGIINLHSRDRDMAGIDLPEQSFFIDYQAMHPNVQPVKLTRTKEDQIPDIRNTFLWEPGFSLKKGASNGISFIVPDYPGEYVVLFRGLNDSGEPVMAETTIKVH